MPAPPLRPFGPPPPGSAVSPLPPLAALAFALALAFTGWAWLGRPHDMVAVPGGRFDCLSYTPYDGTTSPLDKHYAVSEARIRRDLEALTAVTGCVRTYSSLPPQDVVVRIAGELGLKVYAGVWIRGNVEKDEVEIAAGLQAARAHPETVRALVVGNEVLLRRELLGPALAGLLRDVRAISPVPVAYADIYEFWRRNPEVADSVDLVLLHVLPYWDDPTPVSIDAVQAHARHIVELAHQAIPHRPIVIGEIGWPSAGRTRGGAVPSRVNQARFVREFAAGGAALGVPYNLIEAIDQPWKAAPEGTVGGVWGILDRNLEPKFPLAGPVREWPDWPIAFAVAAGLGLLATLPGWVVRRRPGWPGWIALAGLGQLTGSLLVLHADFVAATARSGWGWAGGGWGAALILVAWASLATLVLRPGDGLPTRPASLAALLRSVRRPGTVVATPPLRLAAFAAAVAVPAAVTAVAIAFDGRHRDVPIFCYALPAIALAVRWLAVMGTSDARGPDGRREEAALAFLLAGAAPLTLEAGGNREAAVWALLLLVLALPWLGALRAEAVRIRRLATSPLANGPLASGPLLTVPPLTRLGEREQGRDDGNGGKRGVVEDQAGGG